MIRCSQRESKFIFVSDLIIKDFLTGNKIDYGGSWMVDKQKLSKFKMT